MAVGRRGYLVSSLEAADPKRLGCLLLLLLAFVPVGEAADKLFLGQSLSVNQTLVSNGEVFELGFFRPGKSPCLYIGIWFKKLTPQTVVWVANREVPVSDPSACQFKISDDGGRLHLLLTCSNKIVWPPPLTDIPRSISSAPASANNDTTSFALLEDTGNLILFKQDQRQGSEEAAVSIIWQSFDHPTDTLLSGTWFGRNKTTGETQKLVSWKSHDDPSPGRFSYALDPGGTPQYLLMWNGSQTYWTTGLWNGRWFDNMPEMAQAYRFNNFTFIDNDHWTSAYYATTANKTTRRVLDSATGKLQQFHWIENSGQWAVVNVQPKHSCQVYALCGVFGVCDEDSGSCRCVDGFEPASPSTWSAGDWSDGCVRRIPLLCAVINGGSTRNDTAFRGIKEDGFKALTNIRLPANPRRFGNRDATGEPDCELVCLNYNCSCTAFSFESGVCSIWVGDLLNLAVGDGAGGTLYLRVVDEAMPKKGRHHEINKAVVFAVSAAAGILVFLILGLLWLCGKKKAGRVLKNLGEGSLIVFSYHHLQSATKNFSEKLGAGGFGLVFRGVLPDASAVAVKKLALSHQSEKQFRAEVSTLGKVQHTNLVRLRGFCCNGPHRLLVYDLMPNGSLDRHLFGEGSGTAPNWRTRYHIMIGVARALAYLHEECQEQIVHCDLKPENILLDADFCPKVADFGMAKLIGRDFSRVLTTIRGTRGYLAPEWITGLPISPKVDVYSYGMMLLELVSGKRNSSELRVGDADIYRPLWAATRVSECQVSQLIDTMLESDFKEEELERACRVACWCIQDNEDDRPSMRVIVQVLEGVADLGVPSIPKSLLQLGEGPTTFHFFTEISSEISNRYPSYK